MPRHTSPAMRKALELVESGVIRHAAAKQAGVMPSSLYKKLADLRKKQEKKENQQQPGNQ